MTFSSFVTWFKGNFFQTYRKLRRIYGPDNYLPKPRWWWWWWWPSLMLPCDEETVLCWRILLGVELKMPDRVDPNISWWWPSWWCCWSEAMNSTTGGREPVVDGWGPMLKPFISRRSFCRFFLPPVPVVMVNYYNYVMITYIYIHDVLWLQIGYWLFIYWRKIH